MLGGVHSTRSTCGTSAAGALRVMAVAAATMANADISQILSFIFGFLDDPLIDASMCVFGVVRKRGPEARREPDMTDDMRRAGKYSLLRTMREMEPG